MPLTPVIRALFFILKHFQISGDNCSYADIFIFTCVRTVQETGGFDILREACGGDPFKDCPNILKICKAVGEMPKVIETVGSKFKDCPI